MLFEVLNVVVELTLCGRYCNQVGGEHESLSGKSAMQNLAGIEAQEKDKDRMSLPDPCSVLCFPL